MRMLEVDYCDGVHICKNCQKIFVGGKFKYCPHCPNELIDVYNIKELFEG